MKKPDITPGNWELRNSTELGDKNKYYTAISSGTWQELASVVTSVNDGRDKPEEDTEGKENAKAIVTAVNNTYGKNINPEAIDGLVSAMKSIVAITNPYSVDTMTKINALAEQALKNIYFED